MKSLAMLSLTVISALALSNAVRGQAACPSCQPCNVSPVVQTGSSGPASMNGTGMFPSVVVPTFDTSLGTLTGVQITATAEAVNRKFSAENGNPLSDCAGGDPSIPATLDIQLQVLNPADSSVILLVGSLIDPAWHVEDVFPALGAFDCCFDYGVCDNDPGLGFSFQCCPGCPTPMGTGPIVPPSCSVQPPSCTAPGPQASGYHRTFANSMYSTTTACRTTNLGVFLSSSGPTVSFPVMAIAPETTGGDLCTGPLDKHWESKAKVTVHVTYTFCPSSAPGFCPICYDNGAIDWVCPCTNSGSIGHGCNNSAATGGALLTGAGSTIPDTVVLTSSGELATALSIFLQGDSVLAQPVPFGDGLRCIGGTSKRLYVTNAAAGTTSAPSAGGDSITTRSAALGDPIAPGSSRSYQVYYRDPDLAFCPAPLGDGWNVSTGLTITW